MYRVHGCGGRKTSGTECLPDENAGCDGELQVPWPCFIPGLFVSKVVPVESGSRTLKDAVNEALRDWVTNLSSTHYLVGSCIGPHPFPTIVRDFQKVIGREIKSQLHEIKGKLPDVVVACVGGGSNAIGTFYDFIPDKDVRLVGVEAGGEGLYSDILAHRELTTAEQVSTEIGTVLHSPKENLACFMACGRISYSLTLVR